jgi:hypothetical protein
MLSLNCVFLRLSSFAVERIFSLTLAILAIARSNLNDVAGINQWKPKKGIKSEGTGIKGKLEQKRERNLDLFESS